MHTLPANLLHLPTILTTDSNLHSTLWNPDHDHNHNTNMDRLVKAMTNVDLSLRFPVGSPTFGLDQSNTLRTCIDLVWVNETANNLIMACLIDSNNKFHHNSDHQALIT
ncbi:hypothetical protein CROQUDRAFT_46404, partial [Cronartium quercuum f. sp. fusiforme G11]